MSLVGSLRPYHLTGEKQSEVFTTVTYPGVQKNRYLVSNYGRVYSPKRKMFMKQKCDKDGYPILNLSREDNHSKKSTYFIHRLVAWEFCTGYDESEGRIFVNHINSKRCDPYFENLEWVTSSENAIHSFSEYGNRVPLRGSKCPTSIYVESQVILACELGELGYPRKKISKLTGIDSQYLSEIFTGAKWKHISQRYNFPNLRKITFKGFSENIKRFIILLLRLEYKPKEICQILGIRYEKIYKVAITNLRKKLEDECSTTIENDYDGIFMNSKDVMSRLGSKRLGYRNGKISSTDEKDIV